MRIFQVTIDSSCVNKDGTLQPGADTLVAWYECGWLDLIQTATVRRETEAYSGRDCLKLQGRMGGVPIDVGLPMRDHASPLWGFRESEEQLAAVFRVLFPGVPFPPDKGAQLNDALNIETHRLNGRDLFVSRDKHHRIAAEKLLTGFGVEVLSPEDAVRRIEADWATGTDPRGMPPGGVLFGTNLALVGGVVGFGGSKLEFRALAVGRFTVQADPSLLRDERTAITSRGRTRLRAVEQLTNPIHVEGCIYDIIGPLFGSGGALLVEFGKDGARVVAHDVEVHLVVGRLSGRLRLTVGKCLYREVIVLQGGARVLEARVLPTDRLWVRGVLRNSGGEIAAEITETVARFPLSGYGGTPPLNCLRGQTLV